MVTRRRRSIFQLPGHANTDVCLALQTLSRILQPHELSHNGVFNPALVPHYGYGFKIEISPGVRLGLLPAPSIHRFDILRYLDNQLWAEAEGLPAVKNGGLSLSRKSPSFFFSSVESL